MKYGVVFSIFEVFLWPMFLMRSRKDGGNKGQRCLFREKIAREMMGAEIFCFLLPEANNFSTHFPILLCKPSYLPSAFIFHHTPFLTDSLNQLFPVWIADLISQFSFTAHFDAIRRGVIDFRDVIYFCSIIGFMLVLNVRILTTSESR